jgi:hypothetical protein
VGPRTAEDDVTLRLVALFVMLCCIVLRVVVAYDPFPGWMDDPTQLPWIASTIGPTASVAIDLVMMLAASIVASTSVFDRGEYRKWRARVWRWMLTGAIGVVLHAWWSGWDVDRVTIGVQWTAAMLAGAATYIASSDPQCRRLMAGVLLGCVGLVACRAGVQYLIENPQTYADFKANKANILAAHGWTEDSPLAKSFERRVSQPDAGGWFGLSNVLGSFAAGSLVALGTLAVLAWREKREANSDGGRDALLVAAGVVAAGATLAFSMSKGAIIAAICGVVLTLFSRGITYKSPKRKWGALIGLACIAGPIAGVLVRGLIGDRLGELSIRFRAFYFEGAWNALSEAQAIFGIGPGSFQDAYTSAKPAISPENVSSAHNFMVDHLVAFGLLGLEWCGVVLLFAVNCGRVLGTSRTSEPVREQSLARGEMRFLVAIGAIATLVGALVEREVATPTSTGVRLGGLFAFAIIAIGVTSIANVKPKIVSIAIAAGALAALVHAQIDMVGTSPGSAAWFFALLGLGAGGVLLGEPAENGSDEANAADGSLRKSRTVLQRRVIAAVPIVSVLLVIGLLSPGLMRLWKWERAITAAALEVRPLAMARVLATNASLGTETQRLREAAEVLSAALGQRVEPNPRSVEAAMSLARKALGSRAIDLMTAARESQPRHFGTNRATSELLLSQGVFSKGNGDTEVGRALMTRSREVMESYVSRVTNKAGAWAWLGLVCRTISEEWSDTATSDRAIGAYERAAASDPYGPINIPPLLELLVKAGRTDDARRWANEGLKRQDLTRLDPLAGLSEAQLTRLRELAGTP